MKKQLLFLSLAAAVLLAGCAKNEFDGGGQTVPATHISAKARGASSITVGTKAPVTGTSLNGETADIYVSTYDIALHKSDADVIFSNVYARGTMTFDDNNYVTYDTADFGGKDGGSSLLPQDGTVIHAYGFYPNGWNRTVENTSGENHEALGCTLDGKTDAMATWLTAADDVKLKYNDVANVPDRADLTFKHLLTRYNILMKASDAAAITAWGRVKSVKIKEAAVVNRVAWFKDDSSSPTSFHYNNDGTELTPTAFYKLTGADVAKPTYSDEKFVAADYTASQVLTLNEANACYTMIAPVEVADTNPQTEELTLEIVTIMADNKEKITMVPVSLLQSKFVAADNYSTRGYAITLALNFRAGAIQAIASVEQWKEYGKQNINVDMTESVAPPKIGDLKDGGIVYWIDANDNKHYKVFSLKQPAAGLSACRVFVFMRDAGTGNGATDGRRNIVGMKKYSATDVNGTKDFAADYPAANYCDTYGTDPAGTWYLPSITEMEELSNVYTNNKVLIDGVIGAGTGDAITLTTDSRYLTSSSVSDSNGPLYVVNFGNNTTTSDYRYSNPDMVRCIRSSKAVPLAIGDTKDGGIVYEITDEENYKVFSFDAVHAGKWAEQNTYVIGAKGQSDTDGKANFAAMKAYSTDNTTNGDNTKKTSGDFATDFPATSFCDSKNKDGVTGWYLPAKGELLALYNVYMVNPRAIDVGIYNNSGADFTTNSPVWSSTEDSGDTSSAWEVSFYDGSTVSVNKTLYGSGVDNYVRCVKSKSKSDAPTPPTPPTPALPKIGDLKGGGIVYEVSGSKVKVFSLDVEWRVNWSAQDTYEIGSDGQSDTDGKANVAAMKAYSLNTGTNGTTGVFATDFPAASFCESKNTGSVTGWYLPAKEELYAIDRVSADNKAAIDAGLVRDGGVEWNCGDIWSSTEYSVNTNSAWMLYASMGQVMDKNSKSTQNVVRCFREL